jgi:hypothetical protein
LTRRKSASFLALASLPIAGERNASDEALAGDRPLAQSRLSAPRLRVFELGQKRVPSGLDQRRRPACPD